jgi:alpha-N-acetylglucosamine transferase
MNNKGNGFVYVATGLRFVNEAAESVKYLKQHQNEYICLITDRTYPDVVPFWDDIIIVPHANYNLKDKTYLYLAPYQKCIFLDTDTYITENISELFLLLDNFDIAAHQLFEGHEYEMEGVPHAFPEFNTGVVAYCNTANFEQFCRQWKELFEFYVKDTPNDQRSFRKAIFHSKFRHTVLSPEYNYRPLTINFAIQKLKIIHGRTFPLLKKLEKKMNQKTVHRAYVPTLDAVISDYMEIPDLWAICKRSIILLIKELGKKLIPLALRNRMRDNKNIRRLFLRNDYHEWMR